MTITHLVSLIAGLNAGFSLYAHHWSEAVAWMLVVSYSLECAARKPSGVP